jgi:hypothetical protein
MRVIRKGRANQKAVSNVRAVRLCPVDFKTAGHLQSMINSSFAVFCPACPADFNIPYVTRVRAGETFISSHMFYLSS